MIVWFSIIKRVTLRDSQLRITTETQYDISVCLAIRFLSLVYQSKPVALPVT